MDIYEALQLIDKENEDHFHTEMMRFSDQINNEISEEHKSLFESIRKAMGVRIEEQDGNAKLTYAMIFYGAWRSVGPEDFTDDDYDNLKRLKTEALPLSIRARVADVLWIQKKDYPSALIAIETYSNIFRQHFSVDEWPDALEIIERAFHIARQIKNKQKKEEILKQLSGCLNDNKECGDIVFLLNLIEILTNNGYGNPDDYIYLLISLRAEYKGPIYTAIEKSFELEIQCMQWKGDQEGDKEVRIHFAQYYLEMAERQEVNTFRGIWMMTDCFKKSIDQYQQIGNSDKVKEIQHKLEKMQEENDLPFQTIHAEIDISGFVKYIRESLENLSTEEAVIFLSGLTSIRKKEEIEKEIENNRRSFISMAPISIYDHQGHIVAQLRPLDLENPVGDKKLLLAHMYHKAMEDQGYEGGLLKCAINEIKARNSISIDDLKFLTENNGLISPEREGMILNALRMYFSGQETEALYLLIPQLEHIIRSIVKELGGNTTRFLNDGCQEEKGLGAILDTPELVDSYDENVLFTLKGLLVEATGSNFRNLVAHGLLEDGDAKSPNAAYLICIIIKLLSWTAPKCYKLIKESEKLRKVLSIEPEKM